MRLPLTEVPQNVVTLANPDLSDGETYRFQNLGRQPVYFTYAAAQPDADDWSGILHYADIEYIEITAAEPPWFWSEQHGVEVGVLAG